MIGLPIILARLDSNEDSNLPNKVPHQLLVEDQLTSRGQFLTKQECDATQR